MSEGEEADNRALVIDNGSHTCKVGFAGDAAPMAIVASVVGRPRYSQGTRTDIRQTDCHAGAAAISKKQMLSLKHPIEHGIITNWDDIEILWHHIFHNELKVPPAEHPVLVTEPPMNPKVNREKLTQIMFERFAVPLLYVAKQPSLALHSLGKSTGIVIDIGDGVTHFVPIYGSHILPYATLHTGVSGRDLTDYLMRILTEKGHSFLTTADHEIARDIKEKLCYIALNTVEEAAKSGYTKQTYKLPDGKEIAIGDEQFWCPEALFQPTLIGMEMPGLHEMLSSSISKCTADIRTELYSNIVLSGGSTLFPGFDKRLAEELNHFVPITTNVKVISPPKADLATWLGGSMLGTSEHFHQMCISKEEYDESGPAIVHTKCQLY